MNRVVRMAAPAVVAGLLLVALAGCAMDTVVWGSEGAGVIETTERVIDAAESGDADALSCEASEIDFGEPDDWQGLSAGEPERFNPDYWAKQALLEPDWNINLELSAGATSGRVYPGDLFFRETDEGLCVVDVVWSTVEGSG